MEIWLDTIDVEFIAEAAASGIISGVTTNPQILSKAKHIAQTLSRLLEVQEGPVAVQVTSSQTDGMIEEGRRIFAFSNRMVVKVPVTKEGLAAMHQLRKENIPILATGIFHPMQALLAANQAVTYVTPYFCHIGETKQETLKIIQELLQRHSYTSKLLVASLREVEDLIFCARVGADVVTIKEELYTKMLETPPGLERFSHQFHTAWTEAHGEAPVLERQ